MTVQSTVAGRKYKILPKFINCNRTDRNRDYYTDNQSGLWSLWDNGGIAEAVYGQEEPDGDGDFRFTVEGLWFYANKNFVQELNVPEESKLTVDEYWKIGNTIEFDVKNIKFDQSGFVVGCKSLVYASAGPEAVFKQIRKTDKDAGTGTFRAKIEETPAYRYGVIKIPGGTQVVYKVDAEEWFHNVKIIEKAPEPKPDVTVTMPYEVAQAALYGLGKYGAGGLTHDGYLALRAAVGNSDHIHMFDKVGNSIVRKS